MIDQLVSKMNGGFLYDKQSLVLNIRTTEQTDVAIIVAVRDRLDFHLPLVKHFKDANKEGLTVSITFVEHSMQPDHKDLAQMSGVNYIHIKTDDVFNKCLAFNTGFLYSNKAKNYLFHDIDCMPKSNFWHAIFLNRQNNTARALQAFTKKRVLYCNEYLSNNIVSGAIKVDHLTNHSPDVLELPRHQWAAPGGSIYCTREHFIDVGGYDTEYFTGYSPEDGFFYDKLLITGGIVSCDNPPIELFHLHHLNLSNTNPYTVEQHAIYSDYMALDLPNKLALLNIKSKHFKQFIND